MSRAVAEMQTAGGIVRFDIDGAELGAIGYERVSRRGEAVIADLDVSLEQALASARPAAEAVLEAFRSLSPDHVAIEFGLRLDASAGAVVAKAGVGAHFTIKLDWDPLREQR